MSEKTFTAEIGFALVACEQAQDCLLSAAKIVSRFSSVSAPCADSVKLLADLQNQLDAHRCKLMKIATGGLVLATTIPQGAKQ